jgi:Cu(I)/Ag(I) efflux system membrane fusion protein
VAYDPELYNALTEYREALSARVKIKESPSSDAHERADALLNSSELRLRLLGLSSDQIQQMTADSPDSLNLLLPGKTAWVYGQVYEYEMDLVHSGQTVVVTAPSLPGETYYGTLAAVDSVLDPATRTIRVRAEIENPKMRLRPEMFVHVEIRIPLGEKLSVPVNAVLDTGENKIVFCEKRKGALRAEVAHAGSGGRTRICRSIGDHRGRGRRDVGQLPDRFGIAVPLGAGRFFRSGQTINL